MALKAYKHLTDGEVKIVEADSAEEASVLADVVHGASYVQLQNDGTREEVAAAQGDALWTDVSDELGGGSSFAHLTEDTPNTQIVADWDINVGEAHGILFGDEADIRYWNDGNPYLVAAGGSIGFYASVDTELTTTYAGINADGSMDIQAVLGYLHMAAVGNGLLGIDGNGGGLQLKSPDGTAYNVTVANGGTIAVAAA